MKLLGYLRSYTEIIKETFKRKRDFNSCEEFILKYGQNFKFGFCDPSTPKVCFHNASSYAIKNRDTTYAEGYIFHQIPILHAWVVDSDNRVIETTLKKPASEYFGVKFNLDYVLQISLLRGYYGILDCPDIEFPLLTGKHKYLGNGKVQWQGVK